MPSIDVVMGGLLVLLAASDRFNTPLTNRSSTTAIRYHSAATAYYVIALSAYLLIVTSAQPLSVLSRFVQGIGGGPGGPSPALIAAFALGALLPRTPGVCDIDNWLRRRLQAMAAIPQEVRRLAAEIRRARFDPPADLQEHTRLFVEELGMDRSQLDFGGRSPARVAWTKLSVLRVVLDQWEEDRRFAAFMSAFRSDVEDIKARYGRLVPKAKTALYVAGEGLHSDGVGDARHTQAALAYLTDFQDQAGECAHALLAFMSRALLQCDLTHKARVGHLRSIGFGVRSMDKRFALDELLMVGLAAWVIVLFGFICVPGIVASVSIDEILARTLMIAVIYSVGVACAIYEREHRPNEMPRARVRPVARYLAVALVASACGLMISLWFHVAIFTSFSKGLERLMIVYPWFVLTFLITFMTAVCLDNAAPAGGRGRLRAIEGSSMALVMLLAACGVRAWLGQRATSAGAAGYRVPPLAGVMMISAGIGLFVGWFVPTWYREAPRRSIGEDTGDHEGAPASNVISLTPDDGVGATVDHTGTGNRAA